MVILLIIIIAYSCYLSNLPSVKGDLSPFPREEIVDLGGEVVRLNLNNGSLQPFLQGEIQNMSNIQGISQFSDGKTLYATMWLLGPAPEEPSEFGAKVLSYGVLVDSDSNVDTGESGVDFQKEISWRNDSNGWIGSLVEYASSGNKNLINKSTIPDFEDKTSLPLTLDLKSITSPNKFRVAYYVMHTYTGGRTIDMTSWIDVPPAKFSLLPLQENLVFTKGETMRFGARLLSNTGMSVRVLNFTSEENQTGVMIQFNPDGSNVSSFGATYLPFRITVPRDTDVGKYVIPISGKILIESRKLGLPGTTISIPAESYLTVKTNFTITVANPVSFGDEFKNFWSSYGQVISLFGAGFAGGFSTHILDRIKQRGKKEKI